MPRLGYRLNFAAVAILLGTAQVAWAVRPDLYLDGKNFANRVTEKLLARDAASGTSAAPPYLEVQRIPDLRHSLYSGAPFSKVNSPNRASLLNWMMSQPDDSIGMEAFFLKSLEFTGGNVQKALMLGWDVLREKYPDAEGRNLFPHILKLQDITGERDVFDGQLHQRVQRTRMGKPELVQVKTVRGDNYSAWYHFYGTALASFTGTAPTTGIRLGKADTHFMIFMEEKVLHDEHLDSLKRVKIDRAGSDFGAKLANNFKKFKNLGEFQSAPESKSTDYLYDSPKEYGEKWRLKENQHPIDYGTAEHSLHRTPLVERFRAAQAFLLPNSRPVGLKKMEPEELVPFLQDPNPGIRSLAAPWLEGFGEGDQLKILSQLLATPEDSTEATFVRRQRWDEIYKRVLLIKSDSAQPLYEHLLHNLQADSEQRIQAVFWLQEHAKTPESLLEIAKIAMADPSNRLRAEGVSVLAEFFKSTPRIESSHYELLEKALNDPVSRVVRGEAVAILGPLRDAQSLVIIERTLKKTQDSSLEKELTRILEVRSKDDSDPQVSVLLKKQRKRIASRKGGVGSIVPEVKRCLISVSDWLQGKK